MAKQSSKSMRLKLTFPAKVIGEPLIHTLSHDFRVVPNILRGRISEKNAWLEVEIVGAARDIDLALGYLQGRGVSVEKLR